MKPFGLLVVLALTPLALGISVREAAVNGDGGDEDKPIEEGKTPNPDPAHANFIKINHV